MNILAIHTSHDGALSIIKDDKFLVHAQIERFNHLVANTMPSLSLMLRLKKLGITFDKVIITFLTDSGHW